MIYEIHVHFIDPYGTDISEVLEIPFNEEMNGDDEYIATYLEDKVNEWFYDTSNKVFCAIYSEDINITSNYDYEIAYEEYLNKCKIYSDLE